MLLLLFKIDCNRVDTNEDEANIMDFGIAKIYFNICNIFALVFGTKVIGVFHFVWILSISALCTYYILCIIKNIIKMQA